jgi:hypothetical protein
MFLLQAPAPPTTTDTELPRVWAQAPYVNTGLTTVEIGAVAGCTRVARFDDLAARRLLRVPRADRQLPSADGTVGGTAGGTAGEAWALALERVPPTDGTFECRGIGVIQPGWIESRIREQ